MATLTLQLLRGRCVAWTSRALPWLQAELGQTQNTYELASKVAQIPEERKETQELED